MRIACNFGLIAVSSTSLLHRSSPLWAGISLTVVFAVLARLLKGVTWPGAVAGGIVCFLLYTSAGLGGFALLVCVFLWAWITTRLGYPQKLRLGTAEKREGRTASQVLANLGVAAVCAALFILYRREMLSLAMVAALSEAAADTVSSEFGQAQSRQARLITTWEIVPAGTDGGITLTGTLAGITAAVVVSLVGRLSALISWKWMAISVISAVLGMTADSFLGAWLEGRRWFNNDAVNFSGTLVAAAIASLIA